MRLPSYQQLSKEQDKAINLRLDGSYMVTGPPGTGKTVVALHRASMLTEAGRRALLILHSRLLSQYTEAAVSELGISGITKTFHSWIYGFYLGRYKKMPPQVDDFEFEYDWGEILAVINDDPPPGSSLPYVLVDEGQDLPKEFYTVAAHMTSNLTVFADENQRITKTNSTIKEIRTYGGFKDDQILSLEKNYRNTREIAELAECFYVDRPEAKPSLPDRRGDMPVIRKFDSVEATVEFIARYERTNNDLEIGVFTHTKRLQERVVGLLNHKTKNPVQFFVGGKGKAAAVLDFDVPGIKVVNYPSTKGLEFDTVFIPDLQKLDSRWDEEDTVRQFYVLTSRARDRLYLTYSTFREPLILSRIPEDKADRQ